MSDAAPPPTADAARRAWEEAARNGRLLLGLCRDTGRHFYYPRATSPFTLSPNVEYVHASGAGTIFSVTVARGARPYALALVELSEGPRVVTNIVDCDPGAPRIGQSVQLRWEPGPDGASPPVAMFAPA